VVKCYDDGHWEPKQLFHALAEHNARRRTGGHDSPDFQPTD
jgi:hypothetical protein